MTLATFAAALLLFLAPSAGAQPILLCGADTVFEIGTAASTPANTRPTWSWKADQCKQLPEAMRPTFRTTDDCKPLEGGAKVLICSSSGGCALVERPSGKALWYARVPNAHSLELLPRDRIVVAASTHPQGNRLIVFDVARPERSIAETPLVSAHGLVWDAVGQVLWALGLDRLNCYELKDWETEKPSLATKATHPLPDPGGHDLQPVPGSNELVITAGQHVYLFDRQSHAFRLHPQLGDRASVKSVSIHPATGRTLFIRATESWWSDKVGLLDPPGEIQLPRQRLYKARWLPPPAK